MERVSFILNIKIEDQKEYIARHEAVDPDLLDAFREFGIRAYSIFMDGGTLFGYMEVENWQYAMEQLGQNPANLRWQEFMSDLVLMQDNGSVVKVIPEVFRFES